MKRIIRSNAVIAVPTKEVNTLTLEDNVNSVSLQTILDEQPSVVPYLVVLSSIAFLVISFIWAMNTKVEEASLVFINLAPFSGREKALKTSAPKNIDIAQIPVEQLPLMVEPKVPLQGSSTLPYQNPDISLVDLGDIQGASNRVLGKVVAIFPNQTTNSVNYHTAVKIIPKEFKSTEMDTKYQTKGKTKVRFTHTYRVADMFFKE